LLKGDDNESCLVIYLWICVINFAAFKLQVLLLLTAALVLSFNAKLKLISVFVKANIVLESRLLKLAV
jgi:hypothetical protein